MPFLSKPKTLHWTFHARAKMNFYKLSEQRVRRVLNSPKRVEEGIAPKTVAMMHPASIKRVKSPATGEARSPRSSFSGAGHVRQESGEWQETWNQEIWVMVEDRKSERKIISAWRYPGRTKPRDEILKGKIIEAYRAYMASAKG